MPGVADPGCLSRMILFLLHPGSRILDPTTAPKEEGEKKFFSLKYHKIVNNFIFEHVKKVFLAKTLRIIVLFAPKIVIKLLKIWVWDP